MICGKLRGIVLTIKC
ncbi:hypothetical protein DEL68_004990, partial [Escherichia coli]|nr:hypothetical protein [Escherichia coli]